MSATRTARASTSRIGLATCAASLSRCSGCRAKIIPGMEDATTQDFLHPQLIDPFRNADAFCRLLSYAAASPLCYCRAPLACLVSAARSNCSKPDRWSGQPMPSLHHAKLRLADCLGRLRRALTRCVRGPARRGRAGAVATPSNLTTELSARLAKRARRRCSSSRARARQTPIEDSSIGTGAKPMPPRHRRLPDPAQTGHRLRPRPPPRRVHREALLRPWYALTAHRPRQT